MLWPIVPAQVAMVQSSVVVSLLLPRDNVVRSDGTPRAYTSKALPNEVPSLGSVQVRLQTTAAVPLRIVLNVPDTVFVVDPSAVATATQPLPTVVPAVP